MMLVVIEVKDDGNPEGLLRELRLLQESHEQITSAPDYNPDEDEGDETMRLKTDMVVVNVDRVVGVIEQHDDAAHAITRL